MVALDSAHPQIDSGHQGVSNPEMGYFLQDQENQGIPQTDADIVKNSHLWVETR